MKKNIQINKAMFDWFTISTFDKNMFDYWFSQAKKSSGERKQMRMRQYIGESFETPIGSINVLGADQSGKAHNIIHVTGELSDSLKDIVTGQNKEGNVNINRTDIQVTVIQPDGLSMIDLAKKLESRHKVEFKQSRMRDRNIKLSTVYIGSRTSDRFVRIYQKFSDSGILLRFEVEYKQKRSKAVMRQFEADREVLPKILSYEIHRIREKSISRLFLNAIGNPSPLRVKVAKDTSYEKTVSWLLMQCLPALEKHLQAHDSDNRVWNEYKRIYERISQYRN